MRLETVTDDGEFARLRGEWDALLSASRQDSPFLAHAWLSAWWDAYRGSDELSVVTCRQDGTGRLLGVLPLLTCRRGAVIHARTARFLGDLGVGSTRLSAFASPDVEEAVLGVMTDHLRSDEGPWDVLDLRFMDPNGPFHRLLKDGARVHATYACGSCPRIALPGDWDTYLGGLSKHMRHEVRRQRKRAAERGFLPEVVRDPAALPAAIDDFLRLHMDRMRRSADPSFRVSRALHAFTLATARTMLADGRLRLTFLGVDGGRSAVLYLFRHRDTMYALQSAFDETDAKQDVGRALWAHAIQAAIEEGCTSFDMLLGEQRYKFNWGVTDVLRLSEVHVYNDSLAAEVRRARDMIATWQRGRRAPVRDSAGDEALRPAAGSDAERLGHRGS